jgi:hypothetical protein
VSWCRCGYRPEGLQDELLGGDLLSPQAFAECWSGDDELVLGEQGVPVSAVDLAEPLNQHRADPLGRGQAAGVRAMKPAIRGA